MNRQRSRSLSGKRRNFVVNDPTEKVLLNEFINGIRQYQDDEYKAMRAEFDRVEQLISSDMKPNYKENNLWETKSLPTERHSAVSENQPQFVQIYENVGVVQNNYQYLKWILLFFFMLFFGVLTKLYVVRFAHNIITILEYLRLSIKN